MGIHKDGPNHTADPSLFISNPFNTYSETEIAFLWPLKGMQGKRNMPWCGSI